METSVWKNRKGASLQHVLKEAEQLEQWILRGDQAEIVLIKQLTEKEKNQ